MNEQQFNALMEEDGNKKLVEERLAWQKLHPMPWYLTRKKTDYYRRNHHK